MARAGLSKNRKFLRLARGLNACASGMGALLARGVLETMWSAAYERADDYLGDAGEVELIVDWRGEEGALVRMLLDAGGGEAPGFIEIDPDRGGYRIHDLWDHAPPWVRRKADAEAARKAAGQTISDIRRAARLRAVQQKEGRLPASGQQMVDQMPQNTSPGTGRDGTGIKPPNPPGGQVLALVEVPAKGAFDFEALYAKYPRKEGKTRGMDQCRRQIKTAADFHALDRAVETYRAAVTGHERRFIKQFSSFMSCWRDYLEPQQPDDDEPATEYQPCTATPEEIAAAEERERQRAIAELRPRGISA